MCILILFFRKFLLIVLIGLQFIMSVDVLSILFCTSLVIVSYTSLLGACLLLLVFYFVRSSNFLISVLGLFALIYALDTAACSAIASLWFCLSSLLLSLPILSAIHLSTIYILLSTVSTTLFWAGILFGMSSQDLLSAYAIINLIILIMIWSISVLPRLNQTILILVQILSKLYIFIGTLITCANNQTSDVLSLMPALVLCYTLILSAMDIRTLILVLSSVWLIQVTLLSSHFGLSVAITIYLFNYLLISILLLLLISSCRSFSEICLLVIIVVTWNGMPLMSVAISKLIIIICCLSWGSLMITLLTLTLWLISSAKVILKLLAETSSYPIWFLTFEHLLDTLSLE